MEDTWTDGLSSGFRSLVRPSTSTLYATSAASQRNARPDEPQTRRTPPNATYQHSKPPASFIPTSDCTSPASLTIHGPVEENPPPPGYIYQQQQQLLRQRLRGIPSAEFYHDFPSPFPSEDCIAGPPDLQPAGPGSASELDLSRAVSFDNNYGEREQMRPNCILEKRGRQNLARARQRRKAGGRGRAERWCFVDFTNRLEEARLVCMYGGFCSVALPDCERYVPR